MSTVVSRVGRERSSSYNAKRRVHCSRKLSPLVRSPKSVLHPESSMDCSSSESSMILGEQIVECTSFRTPSKIKEASSKLHSKLTGAAASFEQVDSYTWFVSIDRPSDLIVEIDDISFHLHKLPLLSRSGLLFRLASQVTDSRKVYINLFDCPGGAEAFIVVVKFCYGITSDLTPTNVATIRCVAEYLEMTEAFKEGNVVSKAESFLDLAILTSWQKSIIVLQSCELLLPWAEKMNLVNRCAQSVALKACSPPQEVRWRFSGIENIENTVTKRVVPQEWWYEDVSHLTIYCFSKVVDAIKDQGMSPSLLGGALEYYALRWLPGLVKSSTESVFAKTTFSSTASTSRSSPIMSPRKTSMSCSSDENRDTVTVHESIAEQNRNRFILEEIVSMLPREKDTVSCSFLLRMTRTACMLNCDVECKAELESRTGLQLDQALLSDLLIPCFSHTSEYLYDVDLVRRVLDHFLKQEHSVASRPRSCSGSFRSVSDGPSSATKIPHPGLMLRAKVAKLMDSYLAEIARDSKLPLSKFQFLAEAMPEGSRLCDDGLYRALDTYLKIHPMLSEHERKRLCRILNCSRLSLDACTHASQNERLPLRFVVQVLFCEQLKIRSTVTEVSNSVRGEHRSTTRDNVSVASREPTAHPTARTITSCAAPVTPPSPVVQESINLMEIRALQQELATMRIKCNDLVRVQSTIQDQVERISRNSRGRSSSSSSWSSEAWKKINKLYTSSIHKDSNASGDSSRTDECRSTNPRRWRNSIS